MGAATELHRLVDLALRSPDAGVVNFNHLHTLLHAILNHIEPLGGVLNLQAAQLADEASDKSTSFEQSNVKDKPVSEVDLSSRDDNPLVISDHLGSYPDQRSNFDRFGNLFVCDRFYYTSVVRTCK